MPAYRDDRDALLERADALARDNERLEREARELREENQELRARVPDEAEAPAPKPVVELVEVPKERGATWLVLGIVGTAAAWIIYLVGAATAVWGFISLIATALLVGTFWERARERRAAARARRPRLPGALPVDKRAYEELLATRRKTVNVQLDVTFATPLAATQRAGVEQSLAGAGLAARWDRDILQVRTRRLRIVRGRGDSAVRDPSPINEWCERAFAALGRVHEEHPIVQVRPRATSGRR